LKRRESRVMIPGPLGRGPRPWRAVMVRREKKLELAVAERAHRILDVLGACLMIGVLAPILILRALGARLATGRIFERQQLVGLFRLPFERLHFAGGMPGRSLAALINILRGDLAWTGPRPLTAAEATSVPARAWERFKMRPGLVSPHRIRARIGIAYQEEHEDDRELFYAQSVSGSIGVLARAVPSAMLGGGAPRPAAAHLSFFGIEIFNTTMDEAAGWIAGRARTDLATRLYFVNADCLNIAFVNPEYRAVLRAADRLVADGIGIHLACRLAGTALAENVNGTDLFPRLCERACAARLSIFLLGALPGVAEAAAAAMRVRFPELRIAGAQSGYFDEAGESAAIAAINQSGADILLVAMGAPRQELWIARNRERLRPAVAIGVGGLFDFYSGRIARAPQWMREIGMEWTWRLMKEPRRMWRRYIIGNPLFLYRVWREVRLREPVGH